MLHAAALGEPQWSVAILQSRTLLAAVQHLELMVEGDVLEDQ